MIIVPFWSCVILVGVALAAGWKLGRQKNFKDEYNMAEVKDQVDILHDQIEEWSVDYENHMIRKLWMSRGTYNNCRDYPEGYIPVFSDERSQWFEVPVTVIVKDGH